MPNLDKLGVSKFLLIVIEDISKSAKKMKENKNNVFIKMVFKSLYLI